MKRTSSSTAGVVVGLFAGDELRFGSSELRLGFERDRVFSALAAGSEEERLGLDELRVGFERHGACAALAAGSKEERLGFDALRLDFVRE